MSESAASHFPVQFATRAALADLPWFEEFNPRELSALMRELVLGGLTGRGKRADHTAPNLSRDMRDVGVVHSMVLAIDMAFPNQHPRKTLHTAAVVDDGP